MQIIINRIVFIVIILAVCFAALFAFISLEYEEDRKFSVGYVCGIVSVLLVVVLFEMTKRGMI